MPPLTRTTPPRRARRRMADRDMLDILSDITRRRRRGAPLWPTCGSLPFFAWPRPDMKVNGWRGLVAWRWRKIWWWGAINWVNRKVRDTSLCFGQYPSQQGCWKLFRQAFWKTKISACSSICVLVRLTPPSPRVSCTLRQWHSSSTTRSHWTLWNVAANGERERQRQTDRKREGAGGGECQSHTYTHTHSLTHSSRTDSSHTLIQCGLGGLAHCFNYITVI